MKKKILILSAFVPSRRAGGTIFTQSLIQDIEQDFHVDVVVVTTEHLSHDIGSTPRIHIIKISKLWMYLKTVMFFFLNPLFIRRFSIGVLLKIRSLVAENNYDIVFFDYSQTFLYSLFVKSDKKILNYHDVMIQKFLREIFPVNLLSIPTYIIEMIFSKQKNIKCITPTEKDAMLLQSFYKQDSKIVNYYLNDYVLSLDGSKYNIATNKYFVFFGDWLREENKEGLKWFIENVMYDQIKEYEFLIIGKNLNDKLKALVSHMPNFKYIGFVDNPYEIISNAAAVIAPIFRGAGIKIKVIESLACGTPVLGTKIAFEGLPHGFETFLVLCDTIEQYVYNIRNLNLDIAAKEQLRERFIETYNQNTAGNYLRTLLR